MMTVYNLPANGVYPDEDTFIHSSSRWMRIAIRLLDNSTEIFNDPLAEQIVKEIDKTEHIADGVYRSPWLGIMPWERLSGGAKGLILIMLLDNYELEDIPRLFNSGIWGENCLPLLARLSFEHDFDLLLGDSMGWGQNGNEVLKVCAQTPAGTPITTGHELFCFYRGLIK